MLSFKFKFAGIIAALHRYSLTRAPNPRRNLYIPIKAAEPPSMLFVSFLDGSVHVTLCIASSHISALIIELFALAKSNLNLNS